MLVSTTITKNGKMFKNLKIAITKMVTHGNEKGREIQTKIKNKPKKHSWMQFTDLPRSEVKLSGNYNPI